MNRKSLAVILVLTALAAAVVFGLGIWPFSSTLSGNKGAGPTNAQQTTPQPVSVVRATRAEFTQTVLLTGSLVAREEIMVSSELSSLRIVELGAEEGDHVVKGQVLAKLVTAQLSAQLAQNTAALAKADATILQAGNQILEAEAALAEAQSAFRRTKTLRARGHVSNSAFDTRQAALRTAKARLAAARDGLSLAKADKAQVKAQRQELDWKMGNTSITAPAGGIISHRTARLGAMASGSAEALFKIIAKGEIEFEADVPEVDLPKLKRGQVARVKVAGLGLLDGRVRLIYPEVDKLTRLGKVRIFLGVNPALHIGAFARGEINTASSRGIAVPLSALLFGASGTELQIVKNNHVVTKKVTTGLSSNGLTEIKSGLADNDLVVVRAGTFLRNGDLVRPVMKAKQTLSEAF